MQTTVPNKLLNSQPSVHWRSHRWRWLPVAVWALARASYGEAPIPPLVSTGLAASHDEIAVTSMPPVVIRMASDITGSGWALAWDTIKDGVVTRVVTQIHTTHPDDWGKTGGTAFSHSTDYGKTWSPAQYNHPIPDMVDMWQDRLRNGTLVTFGIREVPPPAAVRELGDEVPPRSRYAYWISADQGRTWEAGTAEVESSRAFGIIARPLPRIFQDPDGTLFMPAYSWDAKGYQALLLRSGNNGKHWTVASSIATSATVRAAGVTTASRYFETMVARVADGSFLAAMRTGSSADSPIVTARSTDGGATWAPPEILRVGPRQRIVPGKLPNLCLLPNGMLVLLVSHIRNHTRLYISPDGTGRNWTDGFALTSQTTGNTSMIGIDYDRILVITSGYPVEYPGPDGRGVRAGEEVNWITSREVTISRKSLERIDLRRKLAEGGISVQSDLRAESAVNPATGIHGAFDGSTLYTSAAMSEDGRSSGQFTIALDRVYRIASVAVALKVGEPESAGIYLSKDGRHWGPPVIQYRDAIHFTTSHQRLEQEVEARFVRVNLSAPRGPAVLGELALYTKLPAGDSPASPSNVTATALGKGVVELAWQAPVHSGEVDHYLITPILVKSPDSVMEDYKYAPIRVEGTSTSFRLERVASRGATYRFSVAAVGRRGGASAPALSREVDVAGGWRALR